MEGEDRAGWGGWVSQGGRHAGQGEAQCPGNCHQQHLGGKFNEFAACLRNMSLRADVLHSFTPKQCQSALKVCLAC